MDEKLLELAEQAWGKHHEIFWFDGNGIERFAELVRLDERTQCAKDYLEDCARAVEKARLEEREAALSCVMSCLSDGMTKVDQQMTAPQQSEGERNEQRTK